MLERVQTAVRLYRWRLTFLFLLLVLSACAVVPKPAPMEAARKYLPEAGQQLIYQHSPALWVEKYQDDFNRPGAVRASSPLSIHIDPDTPIMYVEERHFSTQKGNYTNLLYRIHFKEIPGGFSPFYLGAGENIGLLIIITLGTQGQPLLITTVHTCGCYLAFIPTSNLPEAARPAGWQNGRQSIYGESLPAELIYPQESEKVGRIQIRLRPGTHRVMDVWLENPAENSQQAVPIRLKPMNDLKKLPLENGQVTSFYETSGCRAGYVKGSYKMRERLLMSWWALDWKIGQDKYLGSDPSDGPVFYTSLKPWAREASDLRDFPGFLHYWGWGL